MRFGPDYITTPIIIILCIIICFLLILVGIHSYHFFIVKKHGEGARLRLQFLVVFGLLVSVSSIPQSFLAINVFQEIMDVWMGETLEYTLDESSAFILSYYGDMGDNLEELARSPWLSKQLADYRGVGSFPWDSLHSLNSHIDSVQVFSPLGIEIYGRKEFSLEKSFLDSYPDSFLPVRNRDELILLSYKIQFGESTFVLTSSLLPGISQISESLDEQLDRMYGYNQYQQDSLRWKIYFILFFVFPLFLIAVNMSILFANRLVHPIHELGQALKRVTDGDYSYRISEEDFGVYDFYVTIFNEMIDELNNSRSELVQTEKVGVWRDIAQRLAHEIRNPLTPIKLSAQRVLMKTPEMSEEMQKNLLSPMKRILKEVEELDVLLKEFREFAGQRAPVLRYVNLKSLITEVWESYGKERDEIIFSLVDEEEERQILGDASQLKQVFRNIISNSLDAMDYRGRLSIRLSTIIKGTQGYCHITIRDWGVGIDHETQTRIFEPYYTTRKDGTGLGLPIVERIVTDHKGRIWVESSPGEGSAFFIDLPMGGKFEE